MRGHLQCRDTLAGNEGCPLKTGTTVLTKNIGNVKYSSDSVDPLKGHYNLCRSMQTACVEQVN